MLRRRPSLLVFLAALAGFASGCTSQIEPTSKDAKSSPASRGDDSASSEAPAALVGTWTAGRGGTSISYDTVTGTSSPADASGIAFRFASDGTFAKAFRDSNGGSCPTIVLATESGRVDWQDSALSLHSEHGVMRTWSSCSPDAVTSEELDDSALDRADYAFELDGDELLLTRANDGASARFRRSK